jgi:hypothetical protein
MPLAVPFPTVPPASNPPTGFTYETMARNLYSNVAAAPATGVLWLVAIALPAAFKVGHIAFASVGAAGTPTHWWFGLYDSARVQLATTADQTSTAWAATTLKSLAIATTAAGASTSFTTTYSGLYYVGFLMTATTPVTIPAGNPSAVLILAPPITGGPSDTAQTTPPAFPHTPIAISSAQNTLYAAVGV